MLLTYPPVAEPWKDTMHKPIDYTIVLGRLQVIHNQHLNLFEKALSYSKHLMILLGSAHSSPNIRNPFSWEERREMLNGALRSRNIDPGDVTIIPIEDHYYSDDVWVSEVKKKVYTFARPSQKINIVGYKKDSSSYYLDLFPGWGFDNVQTDGILNASDLRRDLFEKGSLDGADGRLPLSVIKFANDFTQTEKYLHLKDEWECVKEGKRKWENSPYPPVFVTTDALVICSGHVLLVVRGRQPGKGQYALPGGYINPDEQFEESCLRELREETKIDLPPAVLKSAMATASANKREFSHPLRDVRGRVITFAYPMFFKQNKLPGVKGADDAESAFWMPLNEAEKNREMFFCDHYQILRSILKI